MSKIIIGVDPDSKAHGVAIYENGKLEILSCMPLLEIMDLLQYQWAGEKVYSRIEVHIENVRDNNAAFSKKFVKNASAQTAISRTLGMCQQSQIELERLFEYYDIKVVKHKISKIWKKDKAQFEKITGWTGRSNEDTRSAAYFGWLGLN